MSRTSGSYGLTYYLVTAPCRVLWKAAGPLHVYIYTHTRRANRFQLATARVSQYSNNTVMTSYYNANTRYVRHLYSTRQWLSIRIRSNE